MSQSPPEPDLQETAGFIGSLITQARLIWRLLRDPRVSGWTKLAPLAGLIYLLSPIDLLPDLMLPGVGELDDLAVILLSLRLFVQMAPPGVVREHLESLARKRRRPAASPRRPEEAIDVPYRIIGSEDQEPR